MQQQDKLRGPWTLVFDTDGTEDFGLIRDADGQEVVSSQHSQTCWLPESPDDCLDLPTLVYQLKAMAAAPRLLSACRLALETFEARMEADDPRARTQIEWAAEPMASLRAAIAEAEVGGTA